MKNQAQEFRGRLAEGLVVAPSVYDGLTAMLVERAGFDACYMSGDGVAAQLGLADCRLVSLAEMVDSLRYVADAITIPVIADAATWCGSLREIGYSVSQYEDAGAAALILPDGDTGWSYGDGVGVPLGDGVARLSAALDARDNPDFAIVARTSALTCQDWDETLRRVEAYRDAGADLVFVDGMVTVEELERYARDVAAVGLAVYGGSLVPVDRARALGFSVNLAGGGHDVSYLAVRDALLRVREGRSAVGNWSASYFDDLTALLGLDKVYELEMRYGPGAKER